MKDKDMGGPRSDRLPTAATTWLEGRSSLPCMNIIAALEASFNIVFNLFGIGENKTPSETIINRLRTDRLIFTADSDRNQNEGYRCYTPLPRRSKDRISLREPDPRYVDIAVIDL